MMTDTQAEKKSESISSHNSCSNISLSAPRRETQSSGFSGKYAKGMAAAKEGWGLAKRVVMEMEYENKIPNMIMILICCGV